MDFKKWFEDQFGKRPFHHSITQTHLNQRVSAAEIALNRAKHDVELLEQYDRRFDAAFKAWLAKTK